MHLRQSLTGGVAAPARLAAALAALALTAPAAASAAVGPYAKIGSFGCSTEEAST